MKRSLLAFSMILVIATGTNAQLTKTSLAPASFSDSLGKVVLDFRHNFKGIQGAKLIPEDNMDVYRSKISLPGASNCVIYRFRSKFDTTASWQAILFEGESYDEAAKVYKSIFKKIRKSQIKWFDNSYISFSGEMEEPTEDLRFTISSLHLDILDKAYKKFVAEIELVNSFDGWQVKLNMHNKKSDKEQY